MEFDDLFIPEECVVYKSKHSFVFVNIRPFLPYHLLLSPIKKHARMLDVSEEETVDMMHTLRKTMRSLYKLGEGCTVTLQDGEAAGQTVKHLHFHIIPRRVGDLANNNDIYKEAGLDAARPDRSLEDRTEEALFLRKIFAEEFCQ